MSLLSPSKPLITIASVIVLQRLEGLAALGLGVATYAWLGQ